MEGKMVMERSQSTHTKSHKHSFIWDERRRILIKATWWDKLSLSDEISFCFSHDFQHRRGEDFFPEWENRAADNCKDDFLLRRDFELWMTMIGDVMMEIFTIDDFGFSSSPLESAFSRIIRTSRRENGEVYLRENSMKIPSLSEDTKYPSCHKFRSSLNKRKAFYEKLISVILWICFTNFFRVFALGTVQMDHKVKIYSSGMEN